MPTAEKAPPGRRPDPALRALWQDRLLRHHQSGLSAKAFCAQEGLKLSSFHSWRRRLQPADRPTAEPVPLLPVRLRPGPAPVEVLLPGGALLRLGPGCDLDLVRSLVRALAEGQPC